jgi:hypothetical protein
MHISPPAQRLLKLVFTASSAQAVLSRPRLEQQSGLLRAELNAALSELTRLGLLEPQRLRLTLPGLALAVACGARAKARTRPTARGASLAAQMPAPIALFSQREAPRAVA